jgi:hypothetical protein
MCIAEALFRYRKHPRGQSMLDSTQGHRTEMIRRMISHHRVLLHSTLLETGSSGISVSDDDLYEMLEAAARLDRIEGSGSWRTLCRLVRGCATASARAHGDPRDRLALVKRSWAYRLLRAVKRSGIYNRFARGKYGPDFVNPFLD